MQTQYHTGFSIGQNRPDLTENARTVWWNITKTKNIPLQCNSESFTIRQQTWINKVNTLQKMLFLFRLFLLFPAKISKNS